MPRPSHRERLLEEGFKVLLSHGYNGASVRDIVGAAGVPQGSFTNHFRSKEAFAQEVLDRYFALVNAKIDQTLRNDALPPLRRLRAWLDGQIEFLELSQYRTGCLIGNFTLDTSGECPSLRPRLASMIHNIEQSLVYCLRAAIGAGELPKSVNASELASFIYSSWQGAILQAKVEQSDRPLKRFQKVLFGQLLGDAGASRRSRRRPPPRAR